MISRGHRHWFLALLPPLVAFLVQLLLWQYFQPSLWFLFYPAVFISSWIGGLRAAVVASLASAAAAIWYFVPPEQSFAVPGSQYFAAAVFVGTSAFFGFFHDRLRAANLRTAGALVSAERANHRLQRANESVTSLLEQAPDGVLVATPEGRLTEINEAGCRMLGRVREETISERLADLLPAEANAQLKRDAERLRAGRSQLYEWTLRSEDGSTIPVEVSVRVLSDGRWQLFVRDLSARRRLEEALRASHADLERAQTVANVGSWRLDIRRNELVWSDEEYRIFGVPLGTPMTYEAFLACCHPDERELVDAAWKAGLRGEPYDIEHRIVVDGAVKWVRDKAELELDESHELLGGIGVTVDVTERKQHEEELRKARERIELALEGADLAAWDWNMETGEVAFNARWAEMRGFRPDEVRGHVDTWTSGIHPDDRLRVQQVLADCLERRTAQYAVEHRARTRSGQWIWVLDRGKVFARDERGRPTRMAGTELDITARKRTEEELRLAQAKASGIIAISADAIIAVDAEQRITLFNASAERMFGYTAAEAIGAPLEMLLPSRFREVHRRHVDAVAAGATGAVRARSTGAARAEVFGRRKSGEEFPADAAISKISVEGTILLTVSVRDITDQKRIEREQKLLAEVGAVFSSSLVYEETLGSIAELLVGHLADFCIVDVVVDGEVRRQKVASRDPGKAWVCELFKEITLDRSRPHLMRGVLETRRPVLMGRVSPEMVRSFAQSDPHLRALRELDPKSVIAVPLLSRDKLLGALGLVSSTMSRIYREPDLHLAEEIAMRAALAIENAHLYRTAMQAIQARDEVVAVVAHDLRNPLGAILMQASQLRPREGAPERRSPRPGAAIERAAGRMERLINDLLDVTRIEAGRLHVEPGPVGTASVIAACVDAQSALASSASIELRTDVAASVPDAWVDRHRLQQVFENLIGNAIRFTSPGGTITLGAKPGDNEVAFWVSDTGAGIPADALPHVFDRFWHAGQGKRTGTSLGLGLSIVKGIVEAHGGRIWVESTLGRGTTFHFAIPSARAHLPYEAVSGLGR